jgi:hypothetical protein
MATRTGIAWGGQVQRSTTGVANSFTPIPEARGLSVPQVTTEFQDVTSLDSADGFREFVRGLRDAGEISLACNYTPAGYAQQIADQAAAGPIFYRVTMPRLGTQTAGDVFTFRAFPTPSIQADDVGAPISMTITMRITGPVAYVQGAGA